MNSAKLYIQPSTVKNFKLNYEVNIDVKQAIYEAIRSSWTSNNKQLFVVLEVNEQFKNKYSNLLKQSAILECSMLLIFCHDFHKAAIASEILNKPYLTPNFSNLLFNNFDLAMAFNAAITAAHLNDLSVCPIGSFANVSDEIINDLKLPNLLVPFIGLCIGKAENIPNKKPRLPLNTIIMKNQYISEKELRWEIQLYSNLMKDFVAKNNLSRNFDWINTVSASHGSSIDFKWSEILNKKD